MPHLIMSEQPSLQSPLESDMELDLFDDPNNTFDTSPLLAAGETTNQGNSQALSPQTDHSVIKEGCNFVRLLQVALYKYVALPIQKFWYVFVLLYLALLGTSVFFDTRIRASSQPPSFFRKDTNLQQMLDLRNNMSADNYDISDCEICAAIVSNNINSNSVNNPTKKPSTPSQVSTPSTTITYASPKDPGQGGKPNKPHVEQPKTQSKTTEHITKKTVPTTSARRTTKTASESHPG